jgi:hypothetical protein
MEDSGYEFGARGATGLTCDDLDIKRPHAFVLPWRCILSASGSCSVYVICREQVLRGGIEDASHQNSVLCERVRMSACTALSGGDRTSLEKRTMPPTPCANVLSTAKRNMARSAVPRITNKVDILTWNSVGGPGYGVWSICFRRSVRRWTRARNTAYPFYPIACKPME